MSAGPPRVGLYPGAGLYPGSVEDDEPDVGSGTFTVRGTGTAYWIPSFRGSHGVLTVIGEGRAYWSGTAASEIVTILPSVVTLASGRITASLASGLERARLASGRIRARL